MEQKIPHSIPKEESPPPGPEQPADYGRVRQPPGPESMPPHLRIPGLS